MLRSYRQLDLVDRKRLSNLHEKHVSVEQIAEQLGRDRSMIHWELQRNRFVDEEMPELDGYYVRIADQRSRERRSRLLKLVDWMSFAMA